MTAPFGKQPKKLFRKWLAGITIEKKWIPLLPPDITHRVLENAFENFLFLLQWHTMLETGRTSSPQAAMGSVAAWFSASLPHSNLAVARVSFALWPFQPTYNQLQLFCKLPPTCITDDFCPRINRIQLLIVWQKTKNAELRTVWKLSLLLLLCCYRYDFTDTIILIKVCRAAICPIKREKTLET